MEPKEGVRIYELKTSISWFDQEGILCSKSNDQERTLEVVKENVAQIKNIVGKRSVPTLVEVTNMKPMEREARELMAKELRGVYTAMAVISHSALGRMIANLSIHLFKPTWPMKFFKDEVEARRWLKNFPEKKLN